MSLFRSMGVSAAGMAVERFRMDVTAGNLASADVVAQAVGERPFARQTRRRSRAGANGPRVLGTLDDRDGVKQVPMPDSPEADADGNVWMTNVNPVKEMVDMMGATRSYEANVKAFNAAKGMAKSALEIGKA